MPEMKTNIKTIDEYIAAYPADIQERLLQVLAVVRKAAPDAVEGISYGMPGFKLNKKPLVYFAAQTKHLGFYATPSGHSQFAEELSKYKQGKGSVQFPYDQELPLDLIERIVLFRADENQRGKR